MGLLPVGLQAVFSCDTEFQLVLAFGKYLACFDAFKPSEVVDILCSMISDTKDLHKGNSVKIDLYINQ